MRFGLIVCGALLVGLAGSRAEEKLSSQKCLERLARKLKEGIQSFPLETQTQARQVLSQAANSAFSVSLNQAVVPPEEEEKSGEYFYRRYVDNLVQSKALFPSERYQSERNLYLSAAANAFSWEIRGASGATRPQPGQECFQRLVARLKYAREKLRTDQKLLQGAETALRTLFAQEVQYTTFAGEDPERELQRNVALTNSAFPLVTAEQNKANSFANAFLIASARQLFSRATQQR